MGTKQWASFFTSYTDLYLQNVFKGIKHAANCFGYP